MSEAIRQTGPITITAPIKVRVVNGPFRIRLGGQPGPQGRRAHKATRAIKVIRASRSCPPTLPSMEDFSDGQYDPT